MTLTADPRYVMSESPWMKRVGQVTFGSKLGAIFRFELLPLSDECLQRCVERDFHEFVDQGGGIRLGEACLHEEPGEAGPVTAPGVVAEPVASSVRFG